MKQSMYISMRRGWKLWNSQDHEAVYVYKYVQRMETVKQSRPWSSLVSHSPWFFSTLVVKLCMILTFKLNFSLMVNVNFPQKNRDLNQVFCTFKFGDTSLNRWGVMVWTSSKCGKFIPLSKIFPNCHNFKIWYHWNHVTCNTPSKVAS